MDQTVSTAEAQISQVPHTRVSISPSTVPSNSKKGMAIICTMVLSLPTMCTATLLVAPMMAIHSRKDEMAISRPMMISATNTSARSRCTKTNKQAHTKNLSATGSKNAPKAEVWLSLRAKKPSTQSVSANTTNMAVATKFC